MKGTSLHHLLMEREHTSVGARTAQKGRAGRKGSKSPEMVGDKLNKKKRRKVKAKEGGSCSLLVHSHHCLCHYRAT